jgi:hypothetical protein
MNDRLTSAIKRLANQAARVTPPPELEAEILAEFDRVSRRRMRGVFWAAGIAAVAAGLVAAAFLGKRPVQPPAAPVAQSTQFSEQPFVPIPYVTPLGPNEGATVVRVNVPVAALLSAGLPVPVADAGATVEADLVVGQDGRARAVRLVSISHWN